MKKPHTAFFIAPAGVGKTHLGKTHFIEPARE